MTDITDSEDRPLHERVAALNTRLTSVEQWMDSFKAQMTDAVSEIQANTALTEDIHGKTNDMFEIFDTARAWFRFAGKVGSGCMWVIETGGKLAKPLFWIGAIFAAAYTFLRTGTWAMPEWWAWFK